MYKIRKDKRKSRSWPHEELNFQKQYQSFVRSRWDLFWPKCRWSVIQALPPRAGEVVAFHCWFNRNETGWIWGYFINLPFRCAQRKWNQNGVQKRLAFRNCAQGLPVTILCLARWSPISHTNSFLIRHRRTEWGLGPRDAPGRHRCKDH